MKNYSSLLNPHPILQTIGHVADRLNLETCVVGGFVRDLLLDRPSTDIDIVCVGNGMELAQAVAEALGPEVTVQTFQTYGTAMIHWEGQDIEFVGARKESYNRDSRNPDVIPGTLLDDQKRRDFTINALAMRLNQATWGTLVDECNGYADLENGILKTPLAPEITFSDDPLRMMRAIRFATQLQFTIDEQTLAAINTVAERIGIISQERITEELNKIILAPVPSIGFKLLLKTGLLQRIFPQMIALQGKEYRDGHSH